MQISNNASRWTSPNPWTFQSALNWSSLGSWRTGSEIIWWRPAKVHRSQFKSLASLCRAVTKPPFLQFRAWVRSFEFSSKRRRHCPSGYPSGLLPDWLKNPGNCQCRQHGDRNPLTYLLTYLLKPFSLRGNRHQKKNTTYKHAKVFMRWWCTRQ